MHVDSIYDIKGILIILVVGGLYVLGMTLYVCVIYLNFMFWDGSTELWCKN